MSIGATGGTAVVCDEKSLRGVTPEPDVIKLGNVTALGDATEVMLPSGRTTQGKVKIDLFHPYHHTTIVALWAAKSHVTVVITLPNAETFTHAGFIESVTDPEVKTGDEALSYTVNLTKTPQR